MCTSVEAGQYASPFDSIYATDPQERSSLRKKENAGLPVFERSYAIEDASDRYSLKVRYPYFDQPLIDTQIRMWAIQQSEIFAQGTEQVADGSTAFSMNISYQRPVSSSRCLSILFSITTLMGDISAAHGMATFTFDAETGRRLYLHDLFSSPKNLVPFLSIYSYKELSKQPWASLAPGLLVAGTSPVAENYSFFTVDPVGLTIYFPQNQVTESGMGPQKIFIPLSELMAFSPKFEFWGQAPQKQSKGKSQ